MASEPPEASEGPDTLRRTPLFEEHKELGAKLVDFAGWEMPVQYEGVKAEHAAVRERAGLFDVSVVVLHVEFDAWGRVRRGLGYLDVLADILQSIGVIGCRRNRVDRERVIGLTSVFDLGERDCR